jgi:hypothetical protein
MNVFDSTMTGSSPISSLETPDPKDEKAVVKFVDDILHTLKTPKRGHEKRWKEAILMLAGEQWLDFDEATNNFRAANMGDWIPKPVTNFLSMLYDRGIDLFTSGELQANASPATDDQQDIDTSIKTEHILKHLYELLNTDIFHTEAAGWEWATGNLVVFAGYDLKAGEIQLSPRHELKEEPLTVDGQPIVDPETNRAVTQARRVPKHDPDGNPVFDERKEGQVFERIVPTFNWYPEICQHPRDVTYGIEIQVLSLDQLKELGHDEKKLEDVEPEDVSDFSVGNFLDSKLIDPIYEDGGDQYVIYKTYRSEPNSRWEDGRTIITAGGVLLHDGPLERYYNSKLPYEHARYREIPGEFWGIGPLDPVVPLQKRLNAIDANIVQHRKVMLNPQVWEPKGANLQEMTGKMGARIIWDWKSSGGQRPEVKPSVPMSPEIREERIGVIADIERLVGTVEVLTGQQPSGVSTLGQTQILTEQALRRFAPIVRRFRRALGNHERRKALIVQKMWGTPRLVKVVGENELVEVQHFSGADIGNTTDIYISEESGVMFSELFRQQKVEMAINLGALDLSNPNIASKVLDTLEVPGFVSQYTLDAKLARRRLKRLQAGDQVTMPGEPPKGNAIMAKPNDNHHIHFEIISDFTKTTEFENLEEEIQQQITILMAMHQFNIQQQQQQSLMAAEQTRGGGDTATDAVVDTGAMGPAQTSPQQITATA